MHLFWKFALAALCAVLPSAAFAVETWHVTSGVNGDEHLTWTVEHLGEATGGLADYTGPDGNKTGLRIISVDGRALRVLLMHHGAFFCQFDIHEIADGKASGTESCSDHMGGKGTPWSATLDAQQ